MLNKMRRAGVSKHQYSFFPSSFSIKKKNLLLCMCKGGHMHTTACVWMSEDNFGEVMFSFALWVPRNQLRPCTASPFTCWVISVTSFCLLTKDTMWTVASHFCYHDFSITMLYIAPNWVKTNLLLQDAFFKYFVMEMRKVTGTDI